MVTNRRKNPGDPQNDVLTRLIGHKVGGEKLSEPELLQNCAFILNAGHETTSKLIGNTLVALIEHAQNRADLLSKKRATYA